MTERRQPKRVEDFFERVGQPRTPFRDLYVFVLRARWPTVFGLAALAYLVLNAFFALLYWLEPGGLTNADGTYADAFFFSVTTSATIGYGAVSPGSVWTNSVMTVESFLSVILTAMLTGIMFSKFARPHSRVLFSKPLLIERRNGVPTLTFRVANERGNDVVEASMRVSVLKTLQTSDGKRMRRFFDLELERASSPIFVLSWQAFHPIDEKSPLYGLSRQKMIEDDVRFLVAMTAFDGTFAQTIHARYAYWAEDVIVGHKFVDVIETLPGGIARLDFRKFHDIVPDRDRLEELA